jgi:hypothetical protein
MTRLTEDEATRRLCSAPWRNGEDKRFCYATLTRDVTMACWNGQHPPEKNSPEHTAKAGATVLVTMSSRFGDYGIRDEKLVPATEGYWARVDPDALTDWRDEP